MDDLQFTKKVISASKWSSFSGSFIKGIQMITFLAIAWFLTPAEYGIASIGIIIVGFLQILRELGLNKALINTKQNIDDVLNIVFWSHVVMGVLIYIILFFNVSLIVDMFHDARLGNVMRILGLQIIIDSIDDVYIGLYQRDLNFKSLSWINSFTTIFPAIFSVLLAYFGFSYWSIIISNLIGHFVQLIVLWMIHPWHPELKFNLEVSKNLFSYGFWITTDSLSSYLGNWLDVIVIGTFMGITILGIYTIAKNFVSMIYSIIISPFFPVFFSSFSLLQSQVEKFRSMVLLVYKLVLMILLPSGIGLFLTSDLLSTIFFKSNYIGIGQIIGYLSLTFTLINFREINNICLRAIGQAKLSSYFSFLIILISFPIFIISILQNLYLFLLMNFLLNLFITLISSLVLTKEIDLSELSLIKSFKWIINSNFLMILTILLSFIIIPNGNPSIKLLLIILFGIVSYSIFLFPERDFIKKLVKISIS